jgi:peroxiredoxin
MKKRIAAVILLGLLLPVLSFAKELGKSPGEPFADITLSGTLTGDNMAYLGVDAGEVPLRLSDIESEAVLIEVFSMYCPFCQAEAPKVNELFEMLRASDLHEKIRLIGIGAGNSQFEVDFFRKKYGIEFPLFADPDYVVHKAMGEVGTPNFLLVDLREGGEHMTIFSHIGAFDDSKSFLDQLREALKGSSAINK